MLIPERLDLLPQVQFESGNHLEPVGAPKVGCALEIYSWLTDSSWSAAPAYVSPVVAAFIRRWNDGLPSSDERRRLIAPLFPHLWGTATTAADETTRRWMSADWLIRVYAPAWLRLAGLTAHADALAALPAIEGHACMPAVMPVLVAAKDAAPAAAVAAVKAAARETARNAATLIPAQAAARAATVRAWRADARAAAYAAARAAWPDAWSALGFARWVVESAAQAAVSQGQDLAFAVAALQESTADLVRRMCAVGGQS